MAKSEYLTRLRMAVEQMHGCRADHSATVPVHERFQGRTVWQGEVEVFSLTGHTKASRCFAWSHGDGEAEQFVAVLELPPVSSPVTAIRASVAASMKLR